MCGFNQTQDMSPGDRLSNSQDKSGSAHTITMLFL